MGNCHFNPFNANFTKWSKTLKQFITNLPTNCFSVFDHFVGLALKGLIAVAILSKLRKIISKKKSLYDEIHDKLQSWLKSFAFFLRSFALKLTLIKTIIARGGSFSLNLGVT